MDGDQEVTVSPEIETKAREMGWVSKEEFQGEASKWIPADQYVDRGEHLLPILHSTNKRLKEEVAILKAKQAEQDEAIRQSRETIAALETYHEEDVKRKVEAARSELRTQLAEANRSGDHEGAARITEEMTRLNTAEGERTEETRKPLAKPEPGKVSNEELQRRQAAFSAFVAANPWYGTDIAKTGIADAVGMQLRKDHDTSFGEEFYRKVQEGFQKEWARVTGQKAVNKVEGGGATSGASHGVNGKGYADLPQEAKIACDSYEKSLVGPNKPYKTLADWRKKYAADHFREV